MKFSLGIDDVFILYSRTTYEYLDGEVKEIEKRVKKLKKDLQKADKDLQKQYAPMVEVRLYCLFMLIG